MEDGRAQIVFFDLETTMPSGPRRARAILEFGAILVCPWKLEELDRYDTLVRPADPSLVASLSDRSNGISREEVASAPTFGDIADKVYDFLHGRTWAGHNILEFDWVLLKEAFHEIDMPAPEPKGIIDSLHLLKQKFGRRAGDMKMASLARYFDLGEQTHRSLDDVRMNLQVLKNCASILYLESSLPDIFPAPSRRESMSSSRKMEENHPVLSLITPEVGEITLPLIEPNPARADPFDVVAIGSELEIEALPANNVGFRHSYGRNDFLRPRDNSTPLLSVTLSLFFQGSEDMRTLFQNLKLQFRYVRLEVRYGIQLRPEFVDHAGRPKLTFVVDAPPTLCTTLDNIDSFARNLCVDSGSSSEWQPVVTRRAGPPTVRLRLQTVAGGESATEIYQKNGSATHRVVLSRLEEDEVESLFTPGDLVDACFCLADYDYQQRAGIRLVAEELTVHRSSHMRDYVS